MMRILYLHGIGSGAESRTPVELRKDFPKAEILAPELPSDPEEAFHYIKDHYWNMPDLDLVIGTSLGGFYALTVPNVKRVLVNPALFADVDIKEGIGYGMQQFWCERSDGKTAYMIDEDFINNLHSIREHIYGMERSGELSASTPFELSAQTYALFGMKDELLHHYNDFCRLFSAEHAKTFDGAHRLTTEEIHSILAPFVREVLESPL